MNIQDARVVRSKNKCVFPDKPNHILSSDHGFTWISNSDTSCLLGQCPRLPPALHTTFHEAQHFTLINYSSMRYGELDAHINLGDNVLEEYSVTDDGINIVSCWIASEEGKVRAVGP